MTSTLEQNQSNKLFLSIVQGEFTYQVPEGTDGARRREWEVGKKSGVKWEFTYRAISGKIEDVSFYEGENDGRKFTTLNIALEENEDGKVPVITTNVDSRYAQDLMKKLPNVDFSQSVRIRPFSFQPEGEDKTVTGIELTQQGTSGDWDKKITSAFHKREDDKTVTIGDFPVPENKEGMDSDDWKMYFTQVKKFLVKNTKENICPKFVKVEEPLEYPTEEIDPKDIPFD